jgi:hypothetical protein
MVLDAAAGVSIVIADREIRKRWRFFIEQLQGDHVLSLDGADPADVIIFGWGRRLCHDGPDLTLIGGANPVPCLSIIVG